MPYRIRKNDIVIVAGKYANLPKFAGFYERAMRIYDNPIELRKRYIERLGPLGPDDQWRTKWYDLAVAPSYAAYEPITRHGIGPKLFLDPKIADELGDLPAAPDSTTSDNLKTKKHTE